MVKIGNKEATSVVVIYSFSITMLALAGFGATKYGSGAWINHLVCAFVNFIMLISAIYYFKVFGNQNIISGGQNLFGDFTAKTIGLIISFAVFIFVASEFEVACKKIEEIGNQNLKTDMIRVVICASIIVCASCGVEVITRLSYIMIIVISILLFFLLYTTFGGINTDNFFPIFGKSANEVFIPCEGLSLYSGILTLLLICDYFKSKSDVIKSAKRIVLYVNILSLFIIIWYTLSVPYYKGKSSEEGIEAIFASSSSGRFIRRFEVFLLSYYILSVIITATFGLFALSRTLCLICKCDDIKPFILAVGVCLYYCSGSMDTDVVLLKSSLICSCLSVGLPLIYLGIYRIKNRG